MNPKLKIIIGIIMILAGSIGGTKIACEGVREIGTIGEYHLGSHNDTTKEKTSRRQADKI